MALTLAVGISASDRYCTVNQPPTQPPGSYYRIGDEVVQHIGYVTTTPIWMPNFTQLYIARAQLGTTAASHLSGAALTYVRPEFLSATADTDPGPFETGGGGGGGVTNTAPAGSIAVSDGTNLTGSTSLTWDEPGDGRLGLVSTVNGHAIIFGAGPGVEIAIRGGNGDAVLGAGHGGGVGGEIEILSGAGDGDGGGAIVITTGSDINGGDSGALLLATGHVADGRSGSIDIRVSEGGASAIGGSINIVAGAGATGSGGSVVIQPGAKSTGGSHGTLQLYSADGSNMLELSPSQFYFLGPIVFDGLPSADPVNAGQLWNDAGTLKVSAG
jgi:hypothetical protein